MRRHQRGDTRHCGHRPLQADGEHHDEGDELALHVEKPNTEARRSKSILRRS